MRVSLLAKMKPDSYTESCAVNAADGWRERNVWVYASLRSVQSKRPLDVLHPREVCVERSERSNRYRKITLNAQKSAEAIVAGSFFFDEGLNQWESLVRQGKEEWADGYGKQRKLLTKR